MGCSTLLHRATFSPGALSFYELKEGRVHVLVRIVFVEKGNLKFSDSKM